MTGGHERPAAAHGKLRHVVGALVMLSCLAAPRQCFAQRLERVAVVWDNDILALRGTGAPPDYDYTQGQLLTAAFRGAFRPLRRWLEPEGDDAAEAARTTLRLGVGQRIYTPRQDAAEPVPGERPYAGWLYVVADVSAFHVGTEHNVAVELGITGPAALGEHVQNGIHRLVGATPQQGWKHQLHAEPAALVRYTAAWPRTFAGLQLRPHIGVGAGTLWTGAAGGLAIGAAARPANRGLYAGADVRQELVIHNLFLDGNTFRTSVRTDKRAWVSEAAFAVGYRFRVWDIAYRFVIRSAEYRAQPRPHAYGSLVLVWHR